MTTYCKVRGCRFNRTHITMTHKCGTCGKFGHGNWECNHPPLRNRLEQNFKHTELIPINDRCSIYNCMLPWTHTIDAHYCSKCGERGTEHMDNCMAVPANVSNSNNSIINNNNNINNNIKTIKCPSCNKDNCSVDLSKQYSVDGECVVCYNKKQMVLIEPCNHVTVCVDCINMM